MDKEIRDMLQTIISDSVIIDIDMTKWNKYISLMVVSDHSKSSVYYNSKAIFEIKFISVCKFETVFPQDNSIETISENTVWRTHGLDLIKRRECMEINIYQMKNMPSISIQFENIEIRELPHEYINKTFSNLYNGLNSHFIRPSIEDIYNFYIVKKR